MTNVEHDHDHDDVPAAPDELAVVGAFLDGEDVNAQALRRALDDVRARDYLVDLLALRKSVVMMAPLHMPAPRRSRAWWGVAAAASVAIAVGGYELGERHGAGTPRVSHSAPRIEIVTSSRSVTAPPATEVIQLVPGRNWSVKGGN